MQYWQAIWRSKAPVLERVSDLNVDDSDDPTCDAAAIRETARALPCTSSDGSEGTTASQLPHD